MKTGAQVSSSQRCPFSWCSDFLSAEEVEDFTLRLFCLWVELGNGVRRTSVIRTRVLL